MHERNIAALAAPMTPVVAEILAAGATVVGVRVGRAVEWATARSSRRRAAYLRRLATSARNAGQDGFASLIAHAMTQGRGSNPTLLGWAFVRTREEAAHPSSRGAARANALEWLKVRGITLVIR